MIHARSVIDMKMTGQSNGDRREIFVVHSDGQSQTHWNRLATFSNGKKRTREYRQLSIKVLENQRVDASFNAVH